MLELEQIKLYRNAWQSTLEPKALSMIKICCAFYEADIKNRRIVVKPRNFSQLVKLAKVNSHTLNKWLKEAEKKGFILKEKQTMFPCEAKYSLNAPREIQTLMQTLFAHDKWFQTQIEAAAKGYATPKQIIENVLKFSNTYNLWVKMDPSWLAEAPELIRIFLSALALITFWGSFYAIHALPRKEVEKLLKEKGLLQPTERELLEKVLQAKEVS
jgi:DNA-binding HxlR family transcriptional regulator